MLRHPLTVVALFLILGITPTMLFYGAVTLIEITLSWFRII